MTYTLIPNIWYTITPETDCDIETPNGISIHLPAGIQYFHFADSGSIDISGTATVTQNPPLFKPASASALGGGFIESNLRIGHGAAAAVKAVCTLTLGDPTEEGTLEDNSTPVAASVSVTPLESYAAGTTYDMGIGDAGNTYGGFTWTPGEASTPDDFVEALNTLGNWGTGPQQPMETPLVHAELDEDTGKVVLTIVDENWIGTDGNRLKVKEFADNLPISDEVPVSFSGGADKRKLHLDAAPATFAHDFWAMTHPTDGGVLVVGDHTFTAVAEKADAYAYGYFVIDLAAETQLGGTLKLMRGEEEVYSHEFAADEEGEPWTIDSVKAELEADEDWPCTILDEESEIDFQAPVIGESWNDVELVLEGDLFMNGVVYHGGMQGGSTARTLEEALELAVSTINDDEDSPIRAEVSEDSQGNKGIAVYALEAGSGHNYDCWQTTGLFFSVNTSMAYDGEDARTLDEVAAAIAAEGSDFADEVVVTHASGATTLTLTAATAGKAANAIVYTSTGCFGSETVKQGSTTRGKDAVAQTAFKIFLNGEVLDVEPAPTPEELEEDTAMKNHGVYLVTADATAQDFTGITLADNATAEIWLTCTSDDNSVALPGSTEGWIWLDAMPDMEAGKTYAVAARNVGNAVLARPIYEYTTPAES